MTTAQFLQMSTVVINVVVVTVVVWVILTWRDFLVRMRRQDELMMGNYMESLRELNATNHRLNRQIAAREANDRDAT